MQDLRNNDNTLVGSMRVKGSKPFQPFTVSIIGNLTQSTMRYLSDSLTV